MPGNVTKNEVRGDILIFGDIRGNPDFERDTKVGLNAINNEKDERQRHLLVDIDLDSKDRSRTSTDILAEKNILADKIDPSIKTGFQKKDRGQKKLQNYRK